MDQKTGTLTFSAEFPNADGRLRPGQFGRVRAAVETAKDAILIPKRAVQEIQGMQTVLVVGADNMVALRTIQPGETVGDLLIVRDGPEARRTGDRRRHPEGPPRLQGQSDNRRRRQPARGFATRRESRGEIVHGPISSSAGRSSRSSSRS